MRITSQQFDQLEQALRESFVVRAIRFMHLEFPDVAARVDDQELRRLVGFAEQQAMKYGFTTEREIMLYLVVMLKLGARFDDDRRWSALRLPLAEMAGTPSAARIGFLVDMASDILEGERNGY